MSRLVCWLRGHRWEPDGYRLAYVPGGRRYVERCARCGEERTAPVSADDEPTSDATVRGRCGVSAMDDKEAEGQCTM